MDLLAKRQLRLLRERMKCCKTRERDEWKRADNTIVTYVNAAFYPKRAADVRYYHHGADPLQPVPSPAAEKR